MLVFIDCYKPYSGFESRRTIGSILYSSAKNAVVIFWAQDFPLTIGLLLKGREDQNCRNDARQGPLVCRFGEPDKWRGDPFHVVVAWKWSFVDKDGNDISLILQHNNRDEEEKMGNSIKLTMWNLMQAEERCFEKQSTENLKPDYSRYHENAPIDWDRFIPR